ncbi:MAG: YihA family ribosome biogenesis GTP-binding protein [Sinobacteraceae bacterium]|nr:YihA family ribosome biogenesis GTP-binding protein [Nevskiaceae bacterium]MBV9912051.1 YihA family ribosome biogenesis GTP-binding protein [Nevskiaceae bacterium]
MSRFSQGRFLISAAAAGQFPADLGVEVAFAGRSNAGKSSAINAITQRHGLARTSKTPGRTRLLNFFELGPQQRIVDLPGYGYATGPEAERLSWRPLIDALRGRRSLRGLFLIVDARRGLTEGDLTLLQWAQPGLAVHVLLSKADKLNRSESLRVLRETQSRLPAVSVQLFSALQKTGIPEAQRCLEDWLEKKNPDDLCGHRGQTNPVQVS